MAQAAQPQPQPDWWRARQEAVADIAVLPQARDQVRWGPIWAGVIVTLATLIIGSVLGMAIGLTAFESLEAIDTPGLIWSIAVAVVAFFLGGLTAGRSAAVRGSMGGMFNGVRVWALALVLTLLLLALGAGAAFGLLGAFGLTGTEDPQAVFAGMDSMALWWTFGAMAVGLVLCAIGGLIGGAGNKSNDLRTVEEE